MHHFFLFLFFILLGQKAWALPRGGAEVLNPEAYAIRFAGTVFQTTGYFDSEKLETELPASSAYRLMDADLSLSYGMNRQLEVSGFFRARKVSSTVNDVLTERFGVESLAIEGKYAFPRVDNLLYAVGVFYRQTMYSNTTFENAANIPEGEIVLGDSGSEYGGDLYLTYLGKPLRGDFKLGYHSPANDLSDEIAYKLETLWGLGRWGIFAGLEGIYSLKKDEFGDNPSLKPLQAVGASTLFNSTNREKMAPYVGVSYSVGKLNASIKGQRVISGASTDKGQSLELALEWNSGGLTQEAVKVGSFKEYHIEGSVLKVSAQGNFVKIDQGLSTDVEKGMKFDIYQTDYFGGNVLVATGIVYDMGADWSVVKLTKKYQKIEIKPGFAARGH